MTCDFDDRVGIRPGKGSDMYVTVDIATKMCDDTHIPFR
jgi:hypothetical protein